MRCLAAFSLLLSIGSPLFADESAASPVTVTIDVVVAESANSSEFTDLSGPAALARIAELEESDGLASLMRLRLVTIDGKSAMLQFGSQQPVVTGQTITGGRGGFGDGRNSPDARSPARMNSYTYQNTGTLVSAEPALRPDGTILLQFQFERSRLKPAETAEDSEFVPATTETMTATSTIPAVNGTPVVVQQVGEVVGAAASNTVIVVTVKTSNSATPMARHDSTQRGTRVYRLSKLNAAAVAEFLSRVFEHEDVVTAPETVTNSLIFSGSAEKMHSSRGC